MLCIQSHDRPVDVSVKRSDPSVPDIDPMYARIIHVTVAYFELLFLSMLFSDRLRTCRGKGVRISTFHWLVLALFVDSIAFIYGTSLLSLGIGLNCSESACWAAIYVCIVFYVGNKTLAYLFLIERLRAIRNVHLHGGLKQDRLWFGLLVVVVIGLSVITGVFFGTRLSRLSEEGRCGIGIPNQTSIIIISIDATINLGLVGVFIMTLRPLLAFGQRPSSEPYFETLPSVLLRPLWTGLQKSMSDGNPCYVPPLPGNVMKQRELLVWKSVIAAALSLSPTIINLAVLIHLHGLENGWLCLTICTVDVTIPTIIIHWLTTPKSVKGADVVAKALKPQHSEQSARSMFVSLAEESQHNLDGAASSSEKKMEVQVDSDEDMAPAEPDTSLRRASSVYISARESRRESGAI